MGFVCNLPSTVHLLHLVLFRPDRVLPETTGSFTNPQIHRQASANQEPELHVKPRKSRVESSHRMLPGPISLQPEKCIHCSAFVSLCELTSEETVKFRNAMSGLFEEGASCQKP